MPWSGAGVFTRLYSWASDAAANIRIRSDRMDGEFDNYKAGLENCLTRSGETVPTANTPWANFRITGLGNAVNAQDATTARDVQAGGFMWGGTSTGATNIYAVTLTPVPTAYANGMTICFLSHQANTNAATLNVNGLGAKSILRIDGSSLVAGDIPNNAYIEARYDGTAFRIGNTAPILLDGSITTNKLLDGSVTTSKILDGNVTANKIDSSILTLFGYRNLLINGSFLINQRNFAGGAISAGVYGYDHWKAGGAGANYTVSSGVVTLNSGSIVQVIESPVLANAQIMVSATLTSGSLGINVDGQTATLTGTGRQSAALTVPSGSTGNVTLTLTPSGGAVVFTDVQLERGVKATSYERRPPALELLLAQRYYETGRGGGVSYTNSGAGIQRTPVFFKAEKRTTPTMTFTIVSGTATAPTLVAIHTSFAWVAFSATTASQEVIFTYTADAEL